MSEDAIVKKKIFLSNPNKHRPILYINDLIKSLDLIVENHKDLRNEIFNLCSVNETMNNYANYVKNFFKIKIIRLENSNAYSFQMTNTKFIKFTKFVFTTNIETILQNIKNYLLFSKF
jgi:nucleoside-diphosphate-sugar epimerase